MCRAARRRDTLKLVSPPTGACLPAGDPRLPAPSRRCGVRPRGTRDPPRLARLARNLSSPSGCSPSLNWRRSPWLTDCGEEMSARLTDIQSVVEQRGLNFYLIRTIRVHPRAPGWARCRRSSSSLPAWFRRLGLGAWLVVGMVLLLIGAVWLLGIYRQHRRPADHRLLRIGAVAGVIVDRLAAPLISAAVRIRAISMNSGQTRRPVLSPTPAPIPPRG